MLSINYPLLRDGACFVLMNRFLVMIRKVINLYNKGIRGVNDTICMALYLYKLYTCIQYVYCMFTLSLHISNVTFFKNYESD